MKILMIFLFVFIGCDNRVEMDSNKQTISAEQAFACGAFKTIFSNMQIRYYAIGMAPKPKKGEPNFKDTATLTKATALYQLRTLEKDILYNDHLREKVAFKQSVVSLIKKIDALDVKKLNKSMMERSRLILVEMQNIYKKECSAINVNL